MILIRAYTQCNSKLDRTVTCDLRLLLFNQFKWILKNIVSLNFVFLFLQPLLVLYFRLQVKWELYFFTSCIWQCFEQRKLIDINYLVIIVVIVGTIIVRNYFIFITSFPYRFLLDDAFRYLWKKKNVTRFWSLLNALNQFWERMKNDEKKSRFSCVTCAICGKCCTRESNRWPNESGTTTKQLSPQVVFTRGRNPL